MLYVQYVAANIWKVKNVFDVSKTEYESSRIADGRSLCMTENPVSLTVEVIRSRQIALLSNSGSVDPESKGSSGSVIEGTNFQGQRNEESTSHDQDAGEQDSHPLTQDISQIGFSLFTDHV